MEKDISNNKLRAFAGLILLILSIVFLILKSDNSSLETILITLAAFLVGGAIMNYKENTK